VIWSVLLVVCGSSRTSIVVAVGIDSRSSWCGMVTSRNWNSGTMCWSRLILVADVIVLSKGGVVGGVVVIVMDTIVDTILVAVVVRRCNSRGSKGTDFRVLCCCGMG